VEDEPVRSGLLPYLSSLHAAWLADGSAASWREVPGTLVFADVSGFTPLAERLARQGKVGAEELTDTLNTVFRELLDVAGGFGGDCLKFGGDALLLLFTGDAHARRGAAAAHAMLAALRSLRRHGSGAGLNKLGMSLGVHTGTVDAFLAGTAHRELLLAGPTVSGALALESLAEAGQILVSEATAAQLDPGDIDESLGVGLRLRRAPDAPALAPAPVAAHQDIDPGRGIPVLLRAHLDGSQKDGEHRLAAIGFLKFGTTDQLLLDAGPAALSEALESLMSQTQDACARHDVTFLGTDVDRDGGKVLLAAGTPSASPDDEDRLLLTLREIIDEVSSLPLRAGLNRGRIFAVDLGSPARRTFTVMGDAVNLAARVMARASWGELVATQDVLAHRRTDFDLLALEPFSVKGKSKPISAQIVGAARGRRDEAPELTTPLVGRDAEVSLIRAAFAAAHHSEGSIIELVGDPGIGKSKLVAAMTGLNHSLARFTFEAGRYSLATPYFALRRGLRRAMGMTQDTPDDEVESVLRAIVEQTAPELEPWIPLLGIPLGLQLPDTPETARLDPANRQSSLHNAVVRLMHQLLSEPTLITIEDSHWLDAASCELLRSLLTDMERRPWAVLVTRRDVSGGLELPETDVLATIRLKPLTHDALVALALASAQGKPLPPGVVEDLVERSAGNPLFLQELVNAALTGSLAELPETVEAVVATSIDTLPPGDRTLLRHAAVLGNQFPTEVLGRMLAVAGEGASSESPEGLSDAIRRLSHFLVPNREDMVKFRHVLLRDVAYEGLPFRARRALHERAGTILEQSSAHPEALAELLSIHFHSAGRFHDSWRYSRIAGERAQHNGAPVEAAAFFTHALEAARRLDDVSADEQSDTAERLGDTWELGGRYEKAEAAYRHARRLSRHDPVRLGRLCRKIGFIRDHEGRYVQAQRWFLRGIRELAAAKSRREARRTQAELTTASGSSKLRQGRYVEAIPILQEAIRLAEESDERAALAHAYCQLDLAYSELGLHSEASYAERALELYRELGDERGMAAACNQMGIAAYWRGEWDAAVALYNQASEADERAGSLVDRAIYMNNVGEIRSDQGRIAEAEVLLEQAHQLWTGAGWRIGSGWARSNLGRAAARAGRLDEAATILQQACDLLAAIGAEGMLIETEARDVERLAFARDHAAVIDRATELRARAAKLGLANVLNMMDRLEGCAQCQAGRPGIGVPLLERSIIDNRERGADYEAALSLAALAAAGRPVSRPGTDELAAEAARIFERLGVVEPPTVPATPG
jgi:class 3 adenylate cyclase/tetratricopeptide (TPR) repeat protein